MAVLVIVAVGEAVAREQHALAGVEGPPGGAQVADHRLDHHQRPAAKVDLVAFFHPLHAVFVLRERQVIVAHVAAQDKIAIVGAGAVGGYAGAHMVQAGEDVTFIDPWPAHVEHMREHGLRVTHAMKEPEFTVPVRALHVTDAQQLAKEKPVDIAFVCMKSYDTAWATMLIRQYLAADGYVVSLQNCMNEETIAGIVGWGKTFGCIGSSITVNLPEPGHVHRGAAKHGAAHTVFRAGEVHGRITPRAQEVCRLVAYADSAKVTDNLWASGGRSWSPTPCRTGSRAARASAAAT